MHHEILLALSGHPGNIFAVSRQTGLFEVRETYSIHHMHANIISKPDHQIIYKFLMIFTSKLLAMVDSIPY